MTKKTTTDSSVLDTPVIDTPAVEDKPVKPKKKSAAKKEKLELDLVSELDSVSELEPESELETQAADDVVAIEPEIDVPMTDVPYDVDFESPESLPPIVDGSTATTPNSNPELASTPQNNTELPNEYFDSTFNDMEDYGEQSTYHHVQFSGLQANNSRIFGAIPIYSKGMFDIASVRNIIMRDHGCIDVAISGWQAIETREIFNALYGDVSVDDTGEGVTYYHVHYILTDNEGRQVFGHTPAQTAGILNLKAIRNYLAGIYNTAPESVVIMSWQLLANVEAFAALNNFTVNTVESEPNEQ